MKDKHTTVCPYCKDEIDCSLAIESMEVKGIYQVNKKCSSCKNKFELVYGMNGIMTLEYAMKHSNVTNPNHRGDDR